MGKKIQDLAGELRKKADELPDETVQGILRMLESAQEQELNCGQVFALLDEYVERELQDHEAASVMPLIREHFDMCSDCCEEYEALLDAVQNTPNEDEDRAAGA